MAATRLCWRAAAAPLLLLLLLPAHGTEVSFDADTAFTIESVEVPGQYLNVDGNKKAKGANIHLWSNLHSTSSQWRIAPTFAGTFTIQNVMAAGKFLNVDGNKKTNGANIQLWDNPQETSSQWHLRAVADDAFTFENANAGGAFLHMAGASPAQGANIVLLNETARWRIAEAKPAPKYPAARTAEELCPEASMPSEWRARCLAGDLLYGSDLEGGAYPPEVGNGYVASIVRSDTIYAAGLFNGEATNKCGPHPTFWCGPRTRRARIPPYHVNASTELGDAAQGGFALDIAHAVVQRRGLLAQGEIQLDERWYAPYQEPSLLVHELEFTNLGASPQEVELVGQADEATEDLDLSPIGVGDIYAVHGAIKAPERAGGHKTLVAMAANTPPAKVTVAAGGTAVFYALTAITTSLNSTDPGKDVMSLVQHYTADDGKLAKTLLEGHIEAWRQRADRGHVEVDGDLSLAQAVNASLYYIRAAIREDWPHGTSPGGLASNAYNGHTFWDQETWMYPPMLGLEPDVARSMLQYRFDRLEESRRKAQECRPAPEGFMAGWNTKFTHHGNVELPFWTEDPWHPRHGYCTQSYVESPHRPYAIAFGWESALTGVETNQMDDRYGPWAMMEQHLMGDVAFAVWQYFQMTRDVEWLRSVGFPLVNGTASFYAARLVQREPKEGDRPAGRTLYDLPFIMGPNEYFFPITNNIYTNVVAKKNLEFAAEAAQELGFTDAVYDRFKELAAGIFMPEADSVPGHPELAGGYHPENEHFPGEGHCLNGDKCVKQADTIMLNYPLGVNADPRTLANDLDYYATVTDPNGPAMTWSIFAINYFDHQDYGRSKEMFRRGFANMEPPYGVWTEFPITWDQQGAVNFITGAGGFLQSLVFGTSGMRITDKGLTFKPPPPSATGTQATALVLHSLHYLGSRLRQRVTEEEMTFELLHQASEGPRLCLAEGYNEEQVELEVGAAPKSMPRSMQAFIRACNGHQSFEQKYLVETASREAVAVAGSALSFGLVGLAVFSLFAARCAACHRPRGRTGYDRASTESLSAHVSREELDEEEACAE